MKPHRRTILTGITAVLSAPIVSDAAVSGGISPDHPDARVIAICAEYEAYTKVFRKLEETEGVNRDHPATKRLTDLEDAVDESKPVTLDGICAKARAARTAGWFVATPESGQNFFNDAAAALFSVSLVFDILRLAGESAEPRRDGEVYF